MRSAAPVGPARSGRFFARRFNLMPAWLRLFGAQRCRLLPVGLAILVSCAWNTQATAQSVILAWDPAANAAGYRLYSGTTSHVYTQQIDVGNVTSTLVSNLIDGQTYFFAVTAYDATGLESPFSSEISYTSGAPTPTPTPTATPTGTPTPTPTTTATPTTSIQVTVHTNLAGLKFTVDSKAFSVSHTFSWRSGSHHTIAVTSPQSAGTGVRYKWAWWSDGGRASHIVTPTQNTTYTATFATQYYLTMTASVGGSVTPSSGWRRKGKTISISGTPGNGYFFNRWTGNGSGSFSGTSASASVMMKGPITETASFTQSSSPTPTPTPSPTPTATATPTPTPMPTDTPTPTPTDTPSPSATP